MPIDIHGRQYITVAERVQEFHEKCKGSIETELSFDGNAVRCKATVTIDGQKYTGHAEEVRGSTNINKTSAVENVETSAVGRALGFAGFGIAEGVATADEIKIAKAKEKEKRIIDPRKELIWQVAKKLGLTSKEEIETSAGLPVIEKNFDIILERLEIKLGEMADPFTN